MGPIGSPRLFIGYLEYLGSLPNAIQRVSVMMPQFLECFTNPAAVGTHNEFHSCRDITTAETFANSCNECVRHFSDPDVAFPRSHVSTNGSWGPSSRVDWVDWPRRLLGRKA